MCIINDKKTAAEALADFLTFLQEYFNVSMFRYFQVAHKS